MELVETWIENKQLTRFEYTQMFYIAIAEANWFMAILLKDLVFRSSSVIDSLCKVMERGMINLFRKLTENFDLLNEPEIIIPLFSYAQLLGEERFLEKELQQLVRQNKQGATLTTPLDELWLYACQQMRTSSLERISHWPGGER